jgi:hypothetical protein
VSGAKGDANNKEYDVSVIKVIILTPPSSLAPDIWEVVGSQQLHRSCSGVKFPQAKVGEDARTTHLCYSAICED